MVMKHPERDALWENSLGNKWANNNPDLGPNQTECHRATNWGLNLTLDDYIVTTCE